MANFNPLGATLTQLLTALLGGVGDPRGNSNSEQEREQREQMRNDNAKLRTELARYRKENQELLARFDELMTRLIEKKIETFEQLAEQDRKEKNNLVELAKKTKPAPLQGYNIGLFGLTSTGKSTMLNRLLGQDKAKTGAGETILQITSYAGTGYTLWDVPGRNDELSYFSMEYISFFKGLSKRFILIQSTVKENSSLMKLLDEIEVKYDIIFNKFDHVDEEEREPLKQQIQKEAQQLGLKGMTDIYFISAKYPNMFPDWLRLVKNLTS